jgi:MipA family protein
VHPLLRSTLPFVLSALLCARGFAAECSAPSADCAVVGQWEISASFGAGQRSNPVEGKSDIPLVVIPRISYYGKRFFLENLELGFTLHEGEANTLNLVATPGYDRAFFVRSDLQNIFIPADFAVPTNAPAIPAGGQEFVTSPRHTTYLIGPEWTFGYGALIGQVTALHEVTGEHDGQEVRAAIAAPLLRSTGSLVASVGATWKSSDLVRYYYGIKQVYEPESAFSPFVKLRYARPLSDRWTINAFAHYEHLAGAIANSPVVSEDHVTTVFAGVVFRIH